jgi:hypothetical protein
MHDTARREISADLGLWHEADSCLDPVSRQLLTDAVDKVGDA